MGTNLTKSSTPAEGRYVPTWVLPAKAGWLEATVAIAAANAPNPHWRRESAMLLLSLQIVSGASVAPFVAPSTAGQALLLWCLGAMLMGALAEALAVRH